MRWGFRQAKKTKGSTSFTRVYDVYELIYKTVWPKLFDLQLIFDEVYSEPWELGRRTGFHQKAQDFPPKKCGPAPGVTPFSVEMSPETSLATHLHR